MSRKPWRKHAKKRGACARSKVWWTQEIASLRKKRGQAARERRQHPATFQEAKRTLRRAIQRARKEFWNNFIQRADTDQVGRAVRYTAPRLEGKGQTLVDEEGTKERMVIAAFPEAPYAGEQPPLPDGGRANQRINEALVGRLLTKTRNTSVPGGDRTEQT